MGMAYPMTDPYTEDHDKPTLDDVMDTHEDAHPDRRDHAKTPKHISDETLDRDVEIEREELREDERSGQ